MTEEDELKEKIIADVKHCIIREGRDAEECLDEAMETYDLDDSDRKAIRKELDGGGQ